MTNAFKVIATAQSKTGLRRWRLLQKQNGLYLYEELTYQDEVYAIEDDGSEGDVIADAYWLPTHFSGLFETAEEAQADSIGTLPWLQPDLLNTVDSGS